MMQSTLHLQDDSVCSIRHVAFKKKIQLNREIKEPVLP